MLLCVHALCTVHDPLIAVVHLVTQDEYLSSKKCRKCKGWLTQVSPREKKCNSSDCSVTVVNRDDNAQVCALRPPPPSSLDPLHITLPCPCCSRCPPVPGAPHCPGQPAALRGDVVGWAGSSKLPRAPTQQAEGLSEHPLQPALAQLQHRSSPDRPPLPGSLSTLATTGTCRQSCIARALPPPSAFTHSTRIAPLFAPLTYTHAQQAHPLTPC